MQICSIVSALDHRRQLKHLSINDNVHLHFESLHTPGDEELHTADERIGASKSADESRPCCPDLDPWTIPGATSS